MHQSLERVTGFVNNELGMHIIWLVDSPQQPYVERFHDSANVAYKKVEGGENGVLSRNTTAVLLWIYCGPIGCQAYVLLHKKLSRADTCSHPPPLYSDTQDHIGVPLGSRISMVS